MHISEFRVDRSGIRLIGSNLARPESVLVKTDGSVITSDARGGIMILNGTRQVHVGMGVVAGSLPNGLADAGGDEVFYADFSRGSVDKISSGGAVHTVLNEIDGVPLGRVNHICADRGGRLWVTVSTRADNWLESVNTSTRDGYIICIDVNGARIAADSLFFPNECRVDRHGRHLYVAETTQKRVRRFAIQPDGGLGEPELFGPASLGTGLTEGLAFDASDNLWAAMICSDRIVAITPEGDAHEILSDGNPEATLAMEAALGSGENVPVELLLACGAHETNLLTSIAFGGEDRKTVYLGNIKGTSIASFRSPIGGPDF